MIMNLLESPLDGAGAGSRHTPEGAGTGKIRRTRRVQLALFIVGIFFTTKT